MLMVFPAVVGVSLTALTVIVAVSSAALTAVLPPLAKGLVVPPALPVLLSQAR